MKMSRRDVLVTGAAAAMSAVSGLKATAGERSKTAFDIVIVGGGSAGAVLAARLSADANRSVLLLEAGPNFAPGSYPAVLKNANIVAGSPTYDWHYHTDDAARLGHNIPVPRGRVVGGSSAVNAAVAMRARPSDFARWTRRGIDGWSWDDVLPAYKAMENTPSGDDAWHGRSGPFPIRQRTAEEDTPAMRAFVDGSQALGLSHVRDLNGPDPRGVGYYALNVVDGVRINTGMAYLTAAVRARPNLVIRGEAEVDSVMIERKRAMGVKLISGEFIPAGEVILCSGTFGSPSILMRSGIGPSSHLRDLGITAVVDLPVGNRLQDHPFFYNVYALKREANAMTPAAGAIVWTGSLSAASDDLDLQISATHLVDPKISPTGAAIVLACAVTLPKSLGQFRLASRNPRVAPRIRYNFFSDTNDLDRMAEAVQLSRKIGRTAPFSSLVYREMAPGAGIRTDDPAALRANIVANVAAYLHPTSTAPMGAESDSSAVVDPWGRVRGVDALRVVDASIMPEIPSAPTNVTTIMLAERIAATMTA
ncbi:FAD-binding protein [Burkholderia sp. Bp9031]|nr:FAD-binding protein [Burkholderia sp. Bp9031]